MCSIFGYNQQDVPIFSLFFSSMKHRGPDEDGYCEIMDPCAKCNKKQD